MDEFKERFTEEVNELLVNLETSLLELEEDVKNKEAIGEIFRFMHTIKGTAAMFGFKNMGELTHSVEDLFVLLRDESIQPTKQYVDIAFKTVDVLKSLLDTGDEIISDIQPVFDNIIQSTNIVVNEHTNPEEDVATFGKLQEVANKNNAYFYVRYKPDRDILSRGIEPMSVFDELEEFGTFIAFLDLENIPNVDKFDPEDFFLAWDIIITGNCTQEDIEDVFLFFLSHEYSVISIQPEKINEQDFYPDLLNRLGQYQVNENELNKRIVELCHDCVGQGVENQEEVKEEEKVNDQQIQKVKEPKNEAIRVDSKKLDELINLVSELVTLNSQIELNTKHIENEYLRRNVQQLGKLAKRFRDNALNLRLIPVKVLILKMQRLIRDLSGELGKDVDFITEGTGTELDKSIINRLEGPILHIIRNCLDHAIEMPEERMAQSKPPKGVIRFIAFYSGANVFIQIQDDGQGIDVEKVKNKAIEKGIIQPNDELTEQEAYNLIFKPGFSTAGKVTNISGRGVGLDSVKQEITDMRGQVDVESEVGLGTSFTIKLPLTLSIIDTLMTKIGRHTILIPIEFIVQTQLLKETKSDRISFMDKVIPLFNLKKDFDNEEYVDSARIVILRQYDYHYAVSVDRIVGEYQAVVKPLGEFNREHSYFSGSSILGDGNLALILDVNRLISFKNQTLN